MGFQAVMFTCVLMCLIFAVCVESTSYAYNRNYKNNYQRYYSYSPATVGFTVVKTANQTFSEEGLVTFDKVITNVGKPFQASDSKIKIPTTGLYYFSFFIRTESTDIDVLDLVKNGEKIVAAMGTGAGGAVLFARRGDKVSVTARAGTNILTSSDGIKASFSGFLLKSGYFDTQTHY